MTNPSPQVRNTILWGNTAASGGAQIYNESEAVVVTYSDVQGGYSGAGNINADPRFRNAASGDLTLLHTSPAIDAANNSALPADAYDLDGDGNTSEPLPYDLRGDPRQQDIPSVPNSGSGVAPIVDMGAYEASPILFAAPTAQGYDTCGSWANACALQSALSLAQSGDEVWAKAGTHIPTSGADRTATFQLKNGVAIYGGFAGTETARDQRNWMANIVTLSGDIGTVGDNSDNSYHVVTGVTGATLDGVTISGGKADLGVTCPGTSCGGGMFNNSSSPTLTNVIFTHNYGTNGGGMYNYASSPVLTNVIFSGNSAGSNGGGMYNYGGSAPTLTNVLFSGNSAGTTGGGMYNGNSSNPSLANVTFSGNSSTGLGPGIQNSSLASPILKNVILWDSKTPEINNGPGASATVTYSNIQGGYAGAGNINQDPQFVDADGPDNTFGTADDNPRPGFGSPVIDAGTDTGCPAADLDGLLRPNDGNGDSTATCDMGAYEAGEMVCSVSQGSTYSFANQSGVSIQVTTLGPNLACLYADEMELDHPNATGVSGGDGLKTGRYWLIRGLQSDKSTDASDFSVTLTLPTSFIPDSNDGVCRYTGSGLVWDCALTSFDNVAKTVTRTGVGGLSDWAAGKYAGPTAVELSGLKAYSSVSRLYIHVVFAGLALMAGIGFILICRKRPTSG